MIFSRFRIVERSPATLRGETPTIPIWAVGVAALVLFATASCTAAPIGEADGELVIGTMLPLTGKTALDGQGARVAVDEKLAELSSIPELADIQIRVVHTDVGTDGLLVSAAVDELVKNNVDLIIGPATELQTEVANQKLAASGVISRLPLTQPRQLQMEMMADAVVADGHDVVSLVVADGTAAEAIQAFTERIQSNDAAVATTATESPDLGQVAAAIAKSESTAIVVMGLSNPPEFIGALDDADIGPTERRIYVIGNEGSVEPMVGLRVLEVEGSLANRVIDRLTIAALAAVAAKTDDPATIAASISTITAGEAPCSSLADCLNGLRDTGNVRFSGTGGNAFSPEGVPIQVPYRLMVFTPSGEVNETESRVITSR